MNEQIQLQDQMLRFGGGPHRLRLRWGPPSLWFGHPAAVPAAEKAGDCSVCFRLAVHPVQPTDCAAGLHFNVYRILLPFAWLRALMGGSGDPERNSG